MKGLKAGILFVLGMILVMVLMIAVILGVAGKMVEKTLRPINSANEQLKTQVSALLNPTPTIIPDPITIVHEIQSIARLETIRYSVEKVITAGVGGGQFDFLFGDKLLFVAHGEVIAGVDLAKITDQDLWIEGDTLYVRLPETEIFVATLDNEKSYVFDRQTGLLAQQNVNLETEARKAAEAEIQKAAAEDGILELANENAEIFLRSFFMKMGYPSIVFVD